MANPATTLARTTQDERIPGLPVLPVGTDALTLTVPVYNPATDKTHQSPLGGPATTSNAVVGGPKLVQYVDSRYYGVPAGALTLDRLAPATIVPGTVATVDNPASLPLTVTEPPKEYVATLVAAGTAGAVLVPHYIGAAPGDTVPVVWQEIVAGSGAVDAYTKAQIDTLLATKQGAVLQQAYQGWPFNSTTLNLTSNSFNQYLRLDAQANSTVNLPTPVAADVGKVIVLWHYGRSANLKVLVQAKYTNGVKPLDTDPTPVVPVLPFNYVAELTVLLIGRGTPYNDTVPGYAVAALSPLDTPGPTLDPFEVSLAIRQAVVDGFTAQDAADNDSPFLNDPQPAGSVVGMEFDDPDKRYNYRFGPVAFSNGTYNVWRSFLLARAPHYLNEDEVPVAKAQAVVDANVPALDEPDLSYDGKSFYDDRNPNAIVKFECRKSRAVAGPNGYAQSLKWFRTPSMPSVDLLALTEAQIQQAIALTYDLDGDALPADSPSWSLPGMSFDAVDTNSDSWHYYVGRYRHEAGNALSGVGPAWKRFLKLQQ